MKIQPTSYRHLWHLTLRRSVLNKIPSGFGLLLRDSAVDSFAVRHDDRLAGIPNAARDEGRGKSRAVRFYQTTG